MQLSDDEKNILFIVFAWSLSCSLISLAMSSPLLGLICFIAPWRFGRADVKVIKKVKRMDETWDLN